MKIEIKTDETITETTVVIVAKSMNDEVGSILARLRDCTPDMLAGFREDSLELLDPSRVIRVFSEDGRVFAITEDGRYQLRLRLYELEERLAKLGFVRISNSELINLKKVKKFDLDLAGTIRVVFQNGDATYASRRYVSKLKQLLGI